MAWKKIIVSGSQAELANIIVDNNVTASAFSGDGSGLTFNGTGIVSGSSQIVANLVDQDVNLGTGNLTGSNIHLTGDARIDGNITLGGNITIGDSTADSITFAGEVSSSILPDATNTYDLGSVSKQWQSLHINNITASGQISASYFVGDGSRLENITVSQAATVASSFTNQTSVAVSHNFDSKNVNVVVYDSNDTQILPASVTLTDNNTVTVTFDSSTSGRVVVAKGGHIVSGSISANSIDGLNDAINDFLDLDGVISGSVQVDLTSTTNYESGIKDRLNAEGVISSSAQIGDGIISGSTFSSPSQGTVRATINGVNTDVDTGLQVGDSPQFTNLTLTGDLIVQGTTTSIETANLLVEDKFILLNSGSGAPQEGGIIIDEGNGKGHAFVFDSNSARFGFTGSLAHNSTSTAPDAFVGAVVDIDSGHTDKAEYQKNGNIKTDNGTVYIYA